jgi:hypothetical protein
MVYVLFSTVKQKHKRELVKVQSEQDAASRKTSEQHEKKIQMWKNRLTAALEQTAKERAKWVSQLNKLEQELAHAKDRVYVEKAKCRTLVQHQIDETERVEMHLKNYADSLEEENQELRSELKAAISDKRAAERLSLKDKQLAKTRLDKWHAERHLRQLAQDYAVQQKKAANDADRIIEKYKAIIQDSQETKRKLKKEWADEAAAHKRGGARRWPIWVVQLICELLVNGTAPSAIPTNIQTMYETLYGEKPEELPSVNFVRECRVVVEVIGETLAALKLAAAENWKQLWTDATTRRQIPFTALVIGLLGDEDNGRNYERKEYAEEFGGKH